MIGGLIAAVAAVMLVVSLVTAWSSPVCVAPACPTPTGWQLLGLGRPLLLCTALSGLAVAAPAPRAPALRRWVALLAGGVGLGGALYVVHRASILLRPAVVPVVASMAPGPVALRAGPFLAFVACLGVTGGAWLAALGPRVFDRAPWAPAGLLGVVAGAGGGVIALWLPWVHHAPVFEFAGPGPDSVATGWQAAPTLSLLLTLGALAILGGALIAAVVRWRAVYLALAGAGFAQAAFVLAVVPHLGDSPGTGVDVAVAAAIVIVAAGAVAAVAGPA